MSLFLQALLAKIAEHARTARPMAALGLAAAIVGTDLLSLRIGAAIWDGLAVAGILWLYKND